MAEKVTMTVASPWLRPWTGDTPEDQDDPKKCATKQWECMTYEERQKWTEEQAKKIAK